MRTLATIRLAGLPVTLLALSLCCGVGTSRAASQGDVINEQVQLGDVFSSQTLNVEEASEGIGVTTTAVGNIVSGIGAETALRFQSAQGVHENVQAESHVTVNGVTGDYFSTDTSATGNSATAGTCCAQTRGSSLQRIYDGSVISADAYGATGDQAGSISADASAIGNTQGWNQINGAVSAFTDQSNAAQTSATNTGDYHSSPGNIGLSSTAVANNVTVDSESSDMDIGVDQDRSGPGTEATVNLAVGSAVDVLGVATATGNLVDAAASGDLAGMGVTQTGTGPVDAFTKLDLAEWSGDANAIAYGVGNSVVLSNAGSFTLLDTGQTSNGDVSATANFTGGAGKAVFANSTAIGNAVSGYACTECGGEFTGYNRQVNGNRVRSQTNVTIAGRTGIVSADSTAVGNTATYQVFSNGGQ